MPKSTVWYMPGFLTQGPNWVVLGLKFWPKGFFWVYERHVDFFGSRKNAGIFGGIVLFISSNQQ